MKLALGAERPYSSDEILEKTDGGMKETEWLCVISERQGNFAKIDEYERNKGIVFSSNVSVSHALSVSESKDLPKETISQRKRSLKRIVIQALLKPTVRFLTKKDLEQWAINIDVTRTKLFFH